MSALTHSYESNHGYLVKAKPRCGEKPTRTQLRAIHARAARQGWSAVESAERAQLEIEEGERWALAEVAMFGLLSVESGRNTVENCYDIFGWTGLTYDAPIPDYGDVVVNDQPIEKQLEQLGLIESPKPKPKPNLEYKLLNRTPPLAAERRETFVTSKGIRCVVICS